MCTTESVVKGNQATFLVADSGGATTRTRGLDGQIPARADSNTQLTATLVEEHDLVEKTGFNIFESQGPQREIMQKTSMGVVNRKIDQVILSDLSAASVDWGTATAASLLRITKAITLLGNAEVPFDGNICAVITPAFYGYLTQMKEFSSAEYVRRQPLDGQNGYQWQDMTGFWWWSNVKWVVHPNLAGVGTSSATCYMFHKNAIGHAVDTAGIHVDADYDRKQDSSWARATIYMGGKLLQNSGVVKMLHDDSALSA